MRHLLRRAARPRALPCLHTYCLACLQQMLLSDGTKSGSLRCPSCRVLHPACQPARLPKNFHLLHFMSQRRQSAADTEFGAGEAAATADIRRRLLTLCADCCEQLAAGDDAERACQAMRRRLFDLVERRTGALLEEVAARRELLTERKKLAEELARRAAELEDRAGSSSSADYRRLRSDLARTAESLQLPFVFNGVVGSGGAGGGGGGSALASNRLDVARTVDAVSGILDSVRLCTPLAPLPASALDAAFSLPEQRPGGAGQQK
ncbi:hypothetical protein BOX15_Mlig013335g1 [Macrostomum lignano]|uniref:RING-type domain-containing protein n=1 Tax=Macrostomum lignano TaxID=282301 RepID=A0A267E4X6_9PLAT|nr:hypothetical protein BOX15_Mlig013335g1 [Macrostomum lignano]